jgi:hypothetical protein
MITYGATPYIGMTNNETIERVVNQNYIMSKPPKCPDSVYELMKRYITDEISDQFSCWSRDPKDRPNFKQISNELGVILQKEKNAQGIKEKEMVKQSQYSQPDTYDRLPDADTVDDGLYQNNPSLELKGEPTESSYSKLPQTNYYE